MCIYICMSMGFNVPLMYFTELSLSGWILHAILTSSEISKLLLEQHKLPSPIAFPHHRMDGPCQRRKLGTKNQLAPTSKSQEGQAYGSRKSLTAFKSFTFSHTRLNTMWTGQQFVCIDLVLITFVNTIKIIQVDSGIPEEKSIRVFLSIET